MRDGGARTWIGLGFALSLSTAAVLVACGSDGPKQRDTGDGGPSAIIVSDLVVYVGSPAALDAAQTRGSDYVWTVKAAPSGSRLATGSVVSTSARATFTPDVGGEYAVDVSARVSGAALTTAVRVTALAAPIFYLQTQLTDGGRFVEYRAIGSDQSNNHAIACPVAQDDSRSSEDLLKDAFSFADLALDWWEAPAGSAARVAFARVQTSPDGGKTAHLGLGSSESSCAAPPVFIGHREDDPEPEALILQPRFSPDGARVAFVDQLASGYTVESIGFDGSARRKLGRFCTEGTETCARLARVPPRPQWLDVQTVGWARARDDDAGQSWEVVLANDADSPDLRVHMFCPGVVPRTIAFLRDGSVIANTMDVGATSNLAVYRPSQPGGICQLTRYLTTLPNRGSYARDFALSPDESEVAFVRRGTLAGEPEPDGGEPTFGGLVYTVPTSGGEASPLGGSLEYALFGPRYIASASQLAWNGTLPSDGSASTNGIVDAGVPALKVCARGKTDPRTIVVSEPGSHAYVLGGGNGGSVASGCSTAGGGAWSGSFVSLLASVMMLRRARRRSRG